MDASSLTSLTSIAELTGINLYSLMVIMAWSLAWKLAALWKSARRGSLIWFIVLGVVNTIGILEILYIFVFSKMDLDKYSGEKPKRTQKGKSKKRVKKK